MVIHAPGTLSQADITTTSNSTTLFEPDPLAAATLSLNVSCYELFAYCGQNILHYDHRRRPTPVVSKWCTHRKRPCCTIPELHAAITQDFTTAVNVNITQSLHYLAAADVQSHFLITILLLAARSHQGGIPADDFRSLFSRPQHAE